MTEDGRFGQGRRGRTTNNEMELTAIHQALKAHVGLRVLIRTDSKYSIRCLTEYREKWQGNGWITGTGDEAKHKRLIQQIGKLIDIPSANVTFEHVRGHSQDYLNELADGLATKARLGKASQ